MRKLLMLVAAYLAFKGARGAKTAYAPGAKRKSIWSLLLILLAPRFMRVPMLLSALFSSSRKAEPVPVRTRRVR